MHNVCKISTKNILSKKKTEKWSKNAKKWLKKAKKADRKPKRADEFNSNKENCISNRLFYQKRKYVFIEFIFFNFLKLNEFYYPLIN